MAPARFIQENKLTFWASVPSVITFLKPLKKGNHRWNRRPESKLVFLNEPGGSHQLTVPDPPFSSQVATDELMLIAARSESAIAGEAQEGSWAKSNDGWISAPGKGTFGRGRII